MYLKTARSTWSRRATTAIVLAVGLLALAGSTAAATYPTPTPDFSHPGTNHVNRPLFNALGGQEDRPLLVVYPRWTDVDYPPGFDAAAVATRFFGTGFPSTTFPSVGDYFRRLSFNDLFLLPAAETEGTPNDGVVQVSVPETRASFFTKSEARRNRELLQLADPFVDYSSFDADGNGKLSSLELVANVLEAAPALQIPQGCGIARGVEGVSLDGTGLGELSVAMNNTATNLITIIHENAHVATDMPDLYGFGVGRLDIAGPTCGSADMTLFAPNAWQKLHWGWITPTVVTRDGFYDVRRADTTGDAFILYDPDSGTDDYFIVENRTMTAGTYDQGASDNGLAIWRVVDSSLGVATGLRPIEPMLPNGTTAPADYGGSTTDAWNPADPSTPQRTMSRAWADGASSLVAVRAIGNAGDVVRAYFDVRGPGVLVDPYLVDRNGPVTVAALQAASIEVPVLNTGEASDSFTTELVDLPAGWTATSSTQTLAAGAGATVLLQLTPGPGAALGVHAITVRGTSTTDATVTSSATFRVEVVDVVPPTLTVALSPNALWPPNHALETITASVSVSDEYDPNPRIELVSVTSSEPDDGLGDGDTPGDVQGTDVGTDDRSFSLRAERSGSGPGRTYTAVFRATDASGNTSTASATVSVPTRR